jgi:hypothetical protein
VIPIKEIAEVLNPSPKGRRYLAIYRFFCDESYDADPNAPTAIPSGKSGAHIPATFVVSGFLANEDIWERIAGPWEAENRRAGVSRYHAVDLNGRRNEFEGWSKQQQLEYSKNLLSLIRQQKMDMHAVGCGMLVREYEDVITPEGREKFGPPHIACFKMVLAMIAQEMFSLRHKFQSDDKFEVFFDHNKYDAELVQVFLGMKFHPSYPFGGKLAFCSPGTWQEYVQLQAADFIAYESFKCLHRVHTIGDVVARQALESLFSDNGFMSYYLDRKTLLQFKPMIESATCDPNGFIAQMDLRADVGIGIPLP